MFMSAMGAEINLAAPDVCLTPPIPIPIPYVNIVTAAETIPATANIKHLISGMPVCLSTPAGSITPITHGDEAGCMGGVASGTFIGPKFNILGSFKVFSAARPVHKMTGITLQNTSNMIGATISFSQAKVLVLS